jgi:hypothetical protein
LKRVAARQSRHQTTNRNLDLHLFHSRTKRFPKTFSEINGALWRTQPPPNYGTDGRQARTKNYYYFYTWVNDGQRAIWAIPLGPRRDYAPAFFLVIAPGWARTWRGKALDDSAIHTLPSVPSENELTRLQLTELPIQILGGRALIAAPMPPEATTPSAPNPGSHSRLR